MISVETQAVASALTLLEALVFLVDDEPFALANDDLAILGASFD
jgi:hypothetical protein